MRLGKTEADFFARAFRAELNKAARDGIKHENGFWGPEYSIEFSVEVTPKSKRKEEEGD